MGDEKTKANHSVLEAQAFTLPFSFAFADASIYEALRHFVRDIPDLNNMKMRRTEATTGGARYFVDIFSGRTKIRTISFHLRMVEERITVLIVEMDKPPPDYTNEEFESLIVSIVTMIYADHVLLHELIEQVPVLKINELSIEVDDEDNIRRLAPLQITPTQQLQGGRPPEAINEWVRHEVVTKGRDRASVLAEYLERLKIDPDDIEEVERARDRFRKAISRTKRT